jgi:polar amino acid transport system substrate-binding protein
MVNGNAATALRDVGSGSVAALKAKGRLRVGIGLVPAFASKNQATGEIHGIAVELGRALADRIGIELEPVTYPSPGNLPEALEAGAWDIAFLGVDPVREAVMDFSVPYARVDSTFLLAPGSPDRGVGELDADGVRIATTRNGVEDLTLTRLIGSAEIVRVASVGAGFEELKAGTVDAVAVARPAALAFSAQLPGSRVSESHFSVALHAIGVPKGQDELLEYVNAFVSEAKTSGFVRQAMERVGLRGAQVA